MYMDIFLCAYRFYSSMGCSNDNDDNNNNNNNKTIQYTN